MMDFDIHVRLIICLGLLLYAEVVANERLQIVVRQFLNCHIISKKDIPRYEKMIASAVKFSNSTIVEIILFLFVITVGRWTSNHLLPFDISTWYAVKKDAVTSLTLPGYWYAFVSLPIFQFILLRWYYRLLIWYRFLWQVSRLKLRLNSLHPDRAGGIGFLVNSVYGFELFLLAHSCLLAGVIFTAIMDTNAELWQFKGEIITWLTLLVLMPLIPMIFFVIQLAKTKRDGTNEYDIVANQYVTEFHQKWIHPGSKSDKGLLGTSDIQSLADLSNSFSVSAHMRVFPFGKNIVLFIVCVTALPFIPLIFTIIPLDKMIGQMVKIIF